MFVVKHNITNPFFVLAVEDLLVDKFEEDCFMLWNSEPVIVVGRYQNIYTEINLDYLESKNIPVIRRRSGGGAVYNDENTIYYTYITSKATHAFSDYKSFTEPVVKALRKMGNRSRAFRT